MSKTLEIKSLGNERFQITTQDHPDKKWNVDSYELKIGNRDILHECGYTRADIQQDNRYFHVDVTPGMNQTHAVITVEKYPQGPTEFAFPYMDSLTFSEKISELGLPDTDSAYDAFQYMPHLKLVAEFQNGEGAEYTGVILNGTRYDLEEVEE